MSFVESDLVATTGTEARRKAAKKVGSFLKSLVKPVFNPDPQGIPPVGAILMIRDDLKFIVKSHLRRNRLIIQRIPEPKVKSKK